ncbi:MAG: sulfatase, partial [Planctomycetaceae bacterium]|nr:sulfatase [Planctomycetaceae bacterium]
RGGKFSLFEGGIHVPSIISWPAGLPQGQVCDQPAFGCDWYPTLAALCDVAVPNGPDLDGKNIAACITDNASSPHHALYWQSGNQWAVRKGDWKLYGNPQDPSTSKPMPEQDAKLFLANLQDDPGERNNLVEQRKDIVEELLAVRKQYEERIGNAGH